MVRSSPEFRTEYRGEFVTTPEPPRCFVVTGLDEQIGAHVVAVLGFENRRLIKHGYSTVSKIVLETLADPSEVRDYHAKLWLHLYSKRDARGIADLLAAPRYSWPEFRASFPDIAAKVLG